VVTTLPTASPLTYGQALSLSTLTAAQLPLAPLTLPARSHGPPGDSSSGGFGFGERDLHAQPSGRLQPVTISVTVTVGKANTT